MHSSYLDPLSFIVNYGINFTIFTVIWDLRDVKLYKYINVLAVFETAWMIFEREAGLACQIRVDKVDLYQTFTFENDNKRKKIK